MKKLPVSKKVYDDIMLRIHSSLVVLEHRPDEALETMEIIENYLATGITPDLQNHSEIARIVFTLLYPEIDKAIERSRRAREAAARRREAKQKCVTPIQADEGLISETPLQEESAPAILLNRRQRRELERRRRAEARHTIRSANNSKTNVKALPKSPCTTSSSRNFS